MLVTDQAKLIRIPIELRDPSDSEDQGLRVIGRGSAGVRLLNVAADEHVVSAALIPAEDDAEDTVTDVIEEGEGEA